MTKRRFPTSPALAVLVATTLSLITVLPASATSLAMPLHGAQVVNVSFSTQVPLADLSEETLIASQKSGRSFIYRLARDEYAVLKTIIAETCRLTSLNVSTQIQRHNQRNPVMLHINGNANFSVGLKTDVVE